MSQQFHFQVLTPEKWKHVHRKTHARFIYNNQKNKQISKCTSTERGINKLWYIHIVEYYSTIQIMDRCNYMKASQKHWVTESCTQITYPGRVHLIEAVEGAKLICDDRSQTVVASKFTRVGWQLTGKEQRGTFWVDEWALHLDRGDQLHKWTTVQTSQTGNWLPW